MIILLFEKVPGFINFLLLNKKKKARNAFCMLM